jgi:mono/diheme cytochrome c family protein
MPVVAAQPDYSAVAPIFKQRCVVCHSGESAPLGLRLGSYADIKQGSTNGPVVIPGDPQRSELVHRIRGTRQPRMPLTGPPYLSDDEMRLIEAWITAGMPEGEPFLVATVPPPAQKKRPQPGESVVYSDVAQIFLQRCVKCHTDQGLRGGPPEGLRLKNRDQILAGGERVVVVPGSPGASELVRRIRGQAHPRMPLDGPPFLTDDEIHWISDWIAQGAPDDQGRKAPIPMGGKVRLHGRLTGFWELDGFPIEVGSGTRLKKGPSVGDYVQVRGVVKDDGGIRATRIRPR